MRPFVALIWIVIGLCVAGIFDFVEMRKMVPWEEAPSIFPLPVFRATIYLTLGIFWPFIVLEAVRRTFFTVTIP